MDKEPMSKSARYEHRLDVKVKEIPLLSMFGWLTSIVVKIVLVVVNTVLNINDFVMKLLDGYFNLIISNMRSPPPMSILFTAILAVSGVTVLTVATLVLHSIFAMPALPLYGEGVTYPDAPTQSLIESMLWWIIFMYVVAVVAAVL